jgi:hypothetical protein
VQYMQYSGSLHSKLYQVFTVVPISWFGDD